MYLTIKETAEYTNLSEDYIKSLVQGGKIRAVHDGEQFLIYKGSSKHISNSWRITKHSCRKS